MAGPARLRKNVKGKSGGRRNSDSEEGQDSDDESYGFDKLAILMFIGVPLTVSMMIGRFGSSLLFQ